MTGSRIVVLVVDAEPPWITQVRSELSGTRFTELRWVAETGSTNADAAAFVHAAGDRLAPLVFVADHQTAGRGRLDRRWEAPPEQNLLVSAIVRPQCPLARWALVTSAMALAVVEVAAAHGISAGIRWPNDVMVGGGPAPGKLAGVLAELVSDGAAPRAVVCGVGVNVAWPPDAPGGAALGATSFAACGQPVERADVLAALLHGFERMLHAIETAPDELRRRHLALSVTVGHDVRIGGPTAIEGHAVDIDDSGRIVLDTATGRQAFSAGDITHLR